MEGFCTPSTADCCFAADLNWKEGMRMNDGTLYGIVMNVLGFAIACFSLGYTLGKDRSTKK